MISFYQMTMDMLAINVPHVPHNKTLGHVGHPGRHLLRMSPLSWNNTLDYCLQIRGVGNDADHIVIIPE